ncbi:MAG: hypothetical protein AB8F26_09975 [Phycisphaerales bacterium]
MAARTGASIGVAVTITILGLVSVILFVTTMIWYGQSQRAKNDLATAQEEYAQFVSDAQREHATVRAVLEEARGERRSVVEHLMLARAELLRAATGDQEMSLAGFREQLNAVEGAESQHLFALIAEKNSEITRLIERAEVAEDERRAAQIAAEKESERVAAIEAAFSAQGLALTDRVDGFGNQIIESTKGFENLSGKLARQKEETDAEYESEIAALNNTTDDLRNQLIVLQDQLLRCRAEGRTDIILPYNQEALVDGRIDRVDRAVNEVVLSIGRRDKAVLGMTFAVYSNATDIRIDEETGEYAVGKAVLELVRVEDSFSRARIIESSDGNPIIRGDVVANAVYDPKKTYKFVVEGLFDTNGDGLATRYERDELSALIERWGGTIVDEVQGDLDFLVLGEVPVLPVRPGPEAPIAVLNEYNRLQREIDRYNELRLSAEVTSVPLLNSNRLQTLIGDFPD